MSARRFGMWAALVVGLLGVVVTNPALIEATTIVDNSVCGNTLSVALEGVKVTSGEYSQPLNTEFMAQCQAVARADIWPWALGWALSVTLVVGAVVVILVTRRRARGRGASAGS